MDTLNYRKAIPADAEAVREVLMHSYGQFERVLTPEHWGRMEQSMSNETVLQELMEISVTFICEEGGRLAGAVFLVPSGHPTPTCPAEWANVRRLGVHPDFRGRGIGRRLTALCIEEARKQGEQVLGLHTSTIMPDARHIYEGLGFVLERELEPLLGQQYWLYRLNLIG
ncbi:GNAT family N-acetyltransferase [Chitinophaga arvensicola]|uniref:Acetyltransferase (GNAT) family protein n=1 Tax=Chitinophaga arvensicola TaxID=29529 RepID=A0A1I0P155_9BACT|nr:GNAT family N-acetyltransferase [Chitinophaga arvensicola]SEW07699.1 Acetyltransferase (GNAT) family protein [Chitinophaga arvensicola]